MKAPPPPRPSPVPPPDSAMASTTGKYSGLQPAITALTATCSTVAVRYMGMNCTTSPFFLREPLGDVAHAPRILMSRWRVITSSGLWLVPLSIFATRSSVGMTTGRPSVYMANGAFEQPRDVLRLLVELLGFFERAFEEDPRLRGRPPAALLLLFGQRPGQRIEHWRQELVGFAHAAERVARGLDEAQFGDAVERRIVLQLLRLFVVAR